MQPDITPIPDMKLTTTKADNVSLPEATHIASTEEPGSSNQLFDEIHLCGSIACSVSMIASIATIVYFFKNSEKNIYKRKVRGQPLGQIIFVRMDFFFKKPPR